MTRSKPKLADDESVELFPVCGLSLGVGLARQYQEPVGSLATR